MSWSDTMRFRRWAHNVRRMGWLQLLLGFVVAMVASTDDPDISMLTIAGAASIMLFTYGAAAALDRKADQVIAR